MRPFGVSERDLAEPFNERSFVYYGHINTDRKAKYQVIPYLFVKVTASFFRATCRAGGATNGYLKEVDETKFITNKSDPELVRQYHLGEHDIPWLEHKKWGWAKSDASNGVGKVLFADDLEDHTRTNVCHLDKDLLKKMRKDEPLWKEFERRFLR